MKHTELALQTGDPAVDFLNECMDNFHPISINDLARAQSKRDRDSAQWSRLCVNGAHIINPIMRDIITRHANKIARNAGAGAATSITIGDADKVLHRLPNGNRKRSDDTYVSRAYMNKGWSSCYSQRSVCDVSVSARALLLA